MFYAILQQHYIKKMKNYFLYLLFLILSISVNSQELKKVNFDSKFRKENQGKSKTVIHEVKELLHIMIAITELGLGNDDMVNQDSEYYKDLIKHFEPYKNEPIILKYDSLIKANPVNYIFLTGNAISYNFKGNKLVKDKNYLFPAQSVSSHTKITENLITKYKKDIEDFANKSKFRKFYKNSTKYYSKIIDDFDTQANIQQQWNWLENNFETKVNNYVIMTSPLIGGLNYTTNYDDNNFNQIFLVIPTISEDKKLSETEKIINNTRPIFTEIDHNYTVVLATKYEAELNEALKIRDTWVNTKQYGTEFYPNAKRVFDEYMTWSLYVIYISDIFKNDQKAFNYVYNDVNEAMTKRGFPKTKEFTDKLIELRKKNPKKNIEELYPELIEWCKTQ